MLTNSDFNATLSVIIFGSNYGNVIPSSPTSYLTFSEFNLRKWVLLFRLAPFFGAYVDHRCELSLFPSKSFASAFMFTYYHHGGCGLGKKKTKNLTCAKHLLLVAGYVKVYTHVTGDVEIVRVTRDELLLQLTPRQVNKFETSQSFGAAVQYSRSTEQVSETKKKNVKYSQEKWLLKVDRRRRNDQIKDVSLNVNTMMIYAQPYEIKFAGTRSHPKVWKSILREKFLSLSLLRRLLVSS